MNTYTKEINGIKYTIKVDDMLYFQSQALWRAISDIPVGRLKDGFKIQIGFSLYILQKAISGYCIVTPDYEPTPFLKVTEDLTLAFWIQMEQLDMFQNKDGKFSNVDTTEYESIYAYQLLNIRPSVLKALMLPYDYIVVIDGDDIIELLNEKDESIITKNSP